MATTMIKIEKEDVTTNKIGENFMITCKNDLQLIFTEEAIKELIQDYDMLTTHTDPYSGVKPNDKFKDSQLQPDVEKQFSEVLAADSEFRTIKQKSELASKLKDVLSKMTQEEFDKEWSKVNSDELLPPPAPESRILREGKIPKPPTTNT